MYIAYSTKRMFCAKHSHSATMGELRSDIEIIFLFVTPWFVESIYPPSLIHSNIDNLAL